MISHFPLIPAKAGTQFFGRLSFERLPQATIPSARASQKHWVPAFAGMSGECE
jgi:hypothetical protein